MSNHYLDDVAKARNHPRKISKFVEDATFAVESAYEDCINAIETAEEEIRECDRKIEELRQESKDVNTSDTDEYTRQVQRKEKLKHCKGLLVDVSMQIRKTAALVSKWKNESERWNILYSNAIEQVIALNDRGKNE